MRSEAVQLEGAKRTRGTPKLIWVEVVRRGMVACELMADIALDRVECWNMIHVANPSSWDKAVVVVTAVDLTI